MTTAPTSGDEREISEIPWVALALCGLGGFVLLMTLFMIGINMIEPPKNPPPAPWAPYIFPAVGAVLLIAGIVLFKKARVGIRIRRNAIEFPRFEVSIPWPEISEVEVVHVEQGETGQSVPLLVMLLTPAGRKAIRNRLLTNSPHADRLNPRPDICLKFNFIGYGPGIDSPVDFASDLLRRIASASGVPDDTPPLPSLDGPLELRDIAETGPSARIYIHDECGRATEISDGSLHWATNPLRYSAGTMCSHCGKTYDHLLRWADTGETLSRFRSRMWRHTPLLVIALQFLIVPALVGLVVAFVGPGLAPPAPNIGPLAGQAIFFALGFLASIMAIWMTPLGGVIPALAGMKYHMYR